MERRLLLAIVLSVGLILLWNTVLFPPPPPASPKPTGSSTAKTAPLTQTVPAGAAAPQAVPVPSAAPSAPSSASETAPERIEAAGPEERTVETDLFRIRFSNRGAVVLSWQLKKYTDDLGQPLDLVSPGAGKVKSFPLGIQAGDAATTEKLGRALFVVETGPGPGARGTRVSFRYSDGAGLSVVKALDLAPDSYVTHLEVDVRQSGQPLKGSLVWGAGFGPETGLVAKSGNRADVTRAVVYRDGRIVRHVQDEVRGKPAVREEGSIVWAGLEDHYFAGLFLPAGGASGATVRLHPVIEEGREKEFLSLGIDLAPEAKYALYVGPKDYDLLAGLKLGIERIVDFGFFGQIAQILFFLLKHIREITGNWGWSIIILTLFIRLAFFPLTQKSSVSMRRTQEKMKKIQPRIQAIKDRYRKMKKDMASRQKMNDEIMALYTKEGVNPLSGMTGCLPLLLQLPILWGFYNLLSSAIELRHAPFALWITDLSKKDPYYVTPIVMGITMLIQQAMTGNTIPDPAQRRIMMLMPVMFTWFFKELPSGLVLYWLVNNILAIGQQYLINAQVAKEGTAEKVPAKT